MTVLRHLRPVTLAATRFAFAALALVSFNGASAAADKGVPEADRVSRIVILHGSDSRSVGQIQGDAAFRQRVLANRETRVEIFNEDVDFTRFAGSQLEALLVETLRVKHGARRPSVVVAFGSVALDFAEKHHEALWPDAALLFMGLEDGVLAARSSTRFSTGSVMHVSAAATLEVGLALWPSTRRVVVLAGVSEIDRSYLNAARTQLEPFAQRLQFEYLTELSIAEMTARVRTLPPDSLILPISFFRSFTGQSYGSSNVVAALGAAANAPILAIAENYLDRRAVGGHLVRWANQGHATGEMALAIIAGRDPRTLPPRKPENPCVVDWRELRRWNVPLDRVPSQCEIRFREYTLWEQHRGTILAVVAIIVLQALLISALVFQHRRRRRAERETQLQRSQLAHAARLATVGELTASIAHEINQPLGAILSNADAAEILLESPEPDLAEVRQILADIRRDDERASAVIQRLRALLSRQELDRQHLDVNAVVREAITLISQEADRRNTRIVEHLANSLPAVHADRVHMVQVLIVLLINAIDAMDTVLPAARRIVVSTGVVDEKVEIAVKDAGPGIPGADLSRLFDSFFTTKAKGMGLGLSIARSIVEAHGGRIWAENSSGGGAIFRFNLAVAA